MSTEYEHNSPSWLNKKFLEKALRCAEEPDITVVSSSVAPATASGDNYLSVMFRIKIKIQRGGRTEDRSLIIKTEPKVEALLKITDAGNLFWRESLMLREIIPAMHRVLEAASPGEYSLFGARHVYSSTKSEAVIVLEDLKSLGFTMAERMLGLDMNHCLLVLRTLAQYHAASLALHEKDPDMFKPFSDFIFEDEMLNNVGGFFTTTVKKLAEEVEKWPEFKDRFAAKLHELSADSIDVWVKAFTRNEEEFNALGHGDLWMNNMMFRYSDVTGEVDDIRFVDFQFCYWCSPTVDLLYFLNTSPVVDIADQYDVFLREYHKTLGETLKKLGIGRLQPSLEQLEEELNRRGAFGALAGISVRTVVLADRKNTLDMDKVLNEGEGVNFSDTYKDAMKILLPFYEQRGWL